jgi:SAM-dependent methyltransferase
LTTSSVNPNPIDVSIETYDRLYRERGMRSQRMYPNESLVQFLAGRYFGLSPTERAKIRLLEVGSGSGANLWMMCKEGFDTHGIDSSPEGVELARAHLRDKWGVAATIATGSFMQMPYDDRSFDAVIDVVSLQGLPLADARRALREMSRVLKPDGAFFSYRLSDHTTMFEGPDARIDGATLANIGDPAMPLANNGPLSFWSPALAREIYADAGLEVESVERVSRTYASGVLVEYLKIVATPRATDAG